MNEGTGMRDATGPDEGAMDARDAIAIMGEARKRAEHELTINRPAIFASWGLVYLLGYGVIWLSVRGQRPYQAPQGWAIALVIVLAAIACATTVGVTNRAVSGVGGASARRRRSYVLAGALGLGGVYLMEAALRSAGASLGVIAVMGASGPILVAGVVLVASTAVWQNWHVFGLGGWQIVVAGCSGFAGAVGVWAVDALAAGAGFLVVAAVAFARARR
ncbi:hypothetical protein [Trebonia sp.]|uniref:hypothetical protein n=1 Tax=Trebonia sp. TaxID=2767075 RepID=UPI0026357B32|nr:hypothetical protein [Trebonia sp.]